MNSPESSGGEPAGRRVADRDWMLPLLDILFRDYTETAAIRLLRDELARESVAPLLVEALALQGVRGVNLSSAAGDDLLQGLLALRAKFSWTDAREKVIRNIAMSGGGR